MNIYLKQPFYFYFFFYNKKRNTCCHEHMSHINFFHRNFVRNKEEIGYKNYIFLHYRFRCKRIKSTFVPIVSFVKRFTSVDPDLFPN